MTDYETKLTMLHARGFVRVGADWIRHVQGRVVALFTDEFVRDVTLDGFKTLMSPKEYDGPES